MTYAWSLPSHSFVTQQLSVPPLRWSRTRVVIPTYRDWALLRITIESLLTCKPRPAEIVVANDNEDDYLPQWLARYPVILAEYSGNRGPSFARNRAARLCTDRLIDWVYFTDAGCLRAEDFFVALEEACISGTAIAIAGPVEGLSEGAEHSPINEYMTKEGILNPPFCKAGVPQTIITANALVAERAFRRIGGFDTSYPFAAAEDLDLGLRLARLGRIGWAEKANVYHRFEECLDDFRRRFERYGRGNRHLEYRHGLVSIQPSPILAKENSFQYLADLQYRSMLNGYLQHDLVLQDQMTGKYSMAL